MLAKRSIMRRMPSHAASSLADLTSVSDRRPSWYLDLLPPESGDGRLRVAELDAISASRRATALRVSGLDQEGFEALVSRFGVQFSGLYFWKCPRISDLAPLEDLPNLTHVAFYWNQRATRLWDFSKTPNLRGLQFDDFSRLRDVGDLATAGSLEELSFGDAVWVKAVVASLAPLERLEELRALSFFVRRIEDGRIQPLAMLRQLEQLDCPTNLFTTEQLAWLRARLPDATQGRVLAPILRLQEPLPTAEGSAPKDVLVIGKRKPFLSSNSDATRVQRYLDDFWALVERFRENPDLEPG